MSIYQMENPTIGDLEKGDHVRFPDGKVYECMGRRRAKRALGGEALVFRRIQKLSPRTYSKPLHQLSNPDGRAWYEWRLDEATVAPVAEVEKLAAVILRTLRGWRGERFHFPAVEDAEGLPHIERDAVGLEVEETERLARTVAETIASALADPDPGQARRAAVDLEQDRAG